MSNRFLSSVQILILSFIFTIIFTWPFVLKIGTLYDDYGDYPLNGWLLWYDQFSITHGKIFDQDSYFSSNQFYPLPYSLAYSENSLVPSLIFSPFYWLTNNLILSVNILALLTFILSFLSSYFVIYQFTRNKLATLCGSLIYTFNPLVFSHFPGHLQLQHRYFLPLLFFFAYQFFKKTNIQNAFLFSLFFTLNALSSIYFQVFSIATLPVFASPFIIFNLLHKNTVYFLNLFKFGAIFIIFLPILLYFNLPYLQFSSKENINRSINDNIYYSARLIDWIAPNPDSFIYKTISQKIDYLRTPKGASGKLNYAEHTLSLNIIPLFLFIAGLLYTFKKEGRKTLKIVFSLLAVCAFIFSLGPMFLGWNGNSGAFKLPFYYFYNLLPLFKGIRVPTRFEFIFYVSFSLFSSFGFLYLSERLKDKKKTIFLFFIIILLLFIENFNFRNYNSQSDIMNSLQTNNGQLSFLKGKNVVHLPTFANDFARVAGYLNWSTQTEEKLLNGYSGYFPADLSNILIKLDNLDNDSLKKIQLLGIDYIIIHKEFQKDNLIKNLKLYPTEIVFEDNKILILDLKKVYFNLKVCSPDRDFQYLVNFPKSNVYFHSIFYQIIVENNGDCYLTNTLDNRYLKVDTNVDDKSYETYSILPLIIEPKQKIKLNVNIGYKSNTSQNKLSKVKIKVNRLNLYKDLELHIYDPLK